MAQISTQCPPPGEDMKRVLIVGGGYAGTTLAVTLGKALKKRPRPGIEVILVERNPCQQALSELDLVAVGPEAPEFCELWLPAALKNLPIRTCFNRVGSIDTQRRVIITEDGHETDYWRLAICTGAVPRVPPVPGLAENAVTMWSVEDAQELQRRVNGQLRLAARMPSAESRREALSITVCGGGATGIEIVGTIGQLLPKRAAEIGLDPTDLRITVVEGRANILYDLSEPQRAVALRRLKRLGVEVVTGSMISSVTANSVTLADGLIVPAAVLVWAGGAKADPHAAKWGFDTDNNGRIPVGSDLRTRDNTEIYALGDVAAFLDPSTNRTVPMLAQFAIKQGVQAAENILAEIDGGSTAPWVPHQLGEFVSIGPSWGVGWVGRFRLSGVSAIVMKRLTYILYWWRIGGLKLAWARGREMLSMQR